MLGAAKKQDQKTPIPTGEKERFLSQLNDFKGSIDLLKNLMAEMESAYQRAQDLLRSKLQEKEKMLEVQDWALQELEKSLSEKIQYLESQLSEKDNLLKIRDQELEALRSEMKPLAERLTELEAAYQRAETLRQNELRRREETVQVRDSAARELKDHLTGKIRDLGSQLSEKEELLKSRDQELEGLRFEVKVLTGKLAELESACQRAESLLQDEIRKREELIQVRNSVTRIRELKESLSAKSQDQRGSQANEKEENDPFEKLLSKRV
jgi:chromosome segregation ATPase